MVITFKHKKDHLSFSSWHTFYAIQICMTIS
uniref:Uncharacterized protein n=1 Tax=Rhizophora mucronata TaxID=61149 RepID=A0A2P2QSE9_RHIMU